MNSAAPSQVFTLNDKKIQSKIGNDRNDLKVTPQIMRIPLLQARANVLLISEQG